MKPTGSERAKDGVRCNKALKCPSVRSLAYDIILEVNQDWANDSRHDLLVFDEHLLLFLFMGQHQRLGAISP